MFQPLMMPTHRNRVAVADIGLVSELFAGIIFAHLTIGQRKHSNEVQI